MTTTYSRESMLLALQRNLKGFLGHYGLVDEWLRDAFAHHPILGQDILIYGSCDQGFGPWYEMMVLSHGGRPIVTDYNLVQYADGTASYVQGLDLSNCHYIDAVVSISTFEHSGLGRYDDALDPDGDLKAMQSVRALSPSLLYLAVPLGQDKVVEDRHRIYGRQRLPLLLKGWDIIDSYGFDASLLDRDTHTGWCPRDDQDQLIHPEYPEYSPILVLRKATS